jgi:zinc protease
MSSNFEKNFKRKDSALKNWMKTTLSVFLIASLAGGVAACKDKKPDEKPVEQTTKAPEKLPEYQPAKMIEGDPAVEELGTYEGVTALKIGELTVLHKPIAANQVVSAQLYLLGGSQRLGDKSTGIERLALDVATSGGTESTPKDEFNTRLDSVGASIGSFNDRDYSGIAMKTIVPHFDDVWELFTQTVLEPAMPEDVIELSRTRQLTQIAAIDEDADSQVSYLTTQTFFAGHPYAHIQLGTEEAVKSFTRDNLRAWQASLLQPENMLLVVSGSVPREKLVEKVKQSFGKLAPSGKKLPPLPALDAGGPEVAFTQRELPTNYIFGMFQAPSPSHPDYPAMVVAMDYLGDRLFEEVRTKRNLTYAVSAGLSSRRANYGYLYVTAVDPETTLKVMLDQVEELKSKPLPKEALEQTLNVYLTNFYMGQETNSSQASALASAYIMTGDWKYAINLLEKLRAVTPEKIQEVTKKYVKNYHFGVVGPDESKIPKELMKQ